MKKWLRIYYGRLKKNSYRAGLQVLFRNLKPDTQVGTERLLRACRRASSYSVYNYSIIQQILEKRLDELSEEEEELQSKMPIHHNIRGRDYYQWFFNP